MATHLKLKASPKALHYKYYPILSVILEFNEITPLVGELSIISNNTTIETFKIPTAKSATTEAHIFEFLNINNHLVTIQGFIPHPPQFR